MNKLKTVKISSVIVIVLAFAFLLITVSLSNCSPSLPFCVEYYFVYFREQDDAQSASSISSAVESYGGAGYVVEVNDKYYITVACYYTPSDAKKVCENLAERGLFCTTLAAKREKYKLTTAKARKNSQKYLKNLSNLQSLSKTLYSAANSLDNNTAGQDEVKAVLQFTHSTLKGLALENADNCFNSELNYLIAECKDASYGYIKSSSVRALQIAVVDCILNINLC